MRRRSSEALASPSSAPEKADRHVENSVEPVWAADRVAFSPSST
jgi:hypothetical protein